ncbi:MAG: serine--tRNA ligase [Bacteroidia bacterium]|nr:serine--tRNA ligase [Bacteroidia bacterium]
MNELVVLKQNPELAAAKLNKKNVLNAQNAVQEVLIIDEHRKKILTELEQKRAQLNTVSKEIGILMASGQKEQAEKAKEETKILKDQIAQFEINIRQIEQELHDKVILLPNLPHDSVPFGSHAEDNTVVFQQEISLKLPNNPLPHWELATKLNLIDWEAGNKITGSGFPVYIGQGAKLQRALINFFLHEAELAGYTEIQPPILVNADTGYGTGQLPDKEGQMYFTPADNLYLIPTAEVPITNLYRDVIVEEKKMPIKNCGYTPCFRREAGSYGKDVRGLNRLHQFDKVEIVQIAHPERSYEALEEMVAYVKTLVEKLGLPYRILLLCGGDMSFASAKTYDFEVFSGAQERWLEVSSVSNFETFQTNRMKLRFRNSETQKTQLAHTLNGSALALPRIVAALLENNQQADGTIRIPECLQPYMKQTHLS